MPLIAAKPGLLGLWAVWVSDDCSLPSATPQVPLLGPEIVQLALEPLAKLSWKTMPAWAFATRPVQQTIAAVSLIVMERTCSDWKSATNT
jgi:hypothetical protein